MPSAVSSAARRAKRVIESDSESQEEEMELDDDVEEGDDDLDDDDADGDDDDAEAEGDDDPEAEDDAEEDEVEEEEDEIDDDDDEEDAPAPSAVKIKLRVDNKRPAKRQAAKKAAKRTKEDAESDLEDFGADESRATSPSKMTARQRAKHEKEMGEDEGVIDEGLLSLPEGQVKVKPILTEAERLQKREEMARRRKRQNEQRLQDEQDQTINRLLRAQTGRSRSKLDHTPIMTDQDSGTSSPTKQRAVLDVPNGIRWVSKLEGENVTMAVSVQEGNEGWLELPAPSSRTAREEAKCAAKGCNQRRKYRSTKKFELGGCSLPHLKEVEAAL